MAEYKAIDPNVEVRGMGIMSVVSSLGDDATEVLQAHNLYPVNTETWYRQQDWLDAFSHFAHGDYLNLVAIGMKIPDEAMWPPDIKSVHEALSSMNVAYAMNHRNGEIGGYHYTPVSDRTGVMVCDNPYPSDFDYGIIYRTAQKFSGRSASVRVEVDLDQPSRKTGGESCTYHISW